MKKMLIILTLMISSFLYKTSYAQMSVEVNIGVQPIWGPVGYDRAAYYYLPDIDAYYDVPAHQFIYLDGGRWIFAGSLPPGYGNFDLYHSYKVVVNEPKPYLRADVYRNKYAMYKGHHEQQVIRDSHDQRYYVIKEHPEHSKYHPDEHHEQHKDEHHDEHHGEHDKGKR